MPYTLQFDPTFKSVGQKYSLPWKLLKAVAICESALRPAAYRYEPAFWDRYLKNNPAWNTRNPKEVSASYGLMQIMFTTAWQMGFRGSSSELVQPAVNVDLGARLLRKLHDGAVPIAGRINGLSVWDVALARYNGGFTGNPREDGTLRNQEYADRVIGVYGQLRQEP